MKRYNPKELEPKWQKTWADSKIYEASADTSLPKRYVLEYFPYPSGAAMHVGHVRNYTIGDVVARFWRAKGYNVLHPMGWDAFGLPAENYAIKNNISPKQAIAENTTKFKQQLMQMGFSYDWSREINSSDPSYYKWTQWFFKLLYERGLAYQKDSLQWWCETDKTVLANEQVEGGKCWRCGNAVVKKPLKQWFFKITDYADRLSDDLEDLDWSESIKSMQRNWIGKSVGAEIDFKVVDFDEIVKVYTTRPDTLFGATFMVLAPEHPLANKITIDIQKRAVEDYASKSQAKSDIERQETDREKTGVFSGAYAINPASGERIPIWIADYVLVGYGTGAIMAVPAHDERDNEFARKFNLPITRVVNNSARDDECSHAEGIMMNSGEYDSLLSQEAREKIVNDLANKGLAQEKTEYKIRDWLISRQRYWGAPIPIIHCEKDGAVPVPDDQLPVELPEVESYQPTGVGSVLASVPDWVNTICPKCGGPAKRETDTMDGFACSSWYFLRFADPHNDSAPFDPDKAKFWLPVDDYIGGAEHAVMHLLYARMWTKVMYDAGLIEFNEPFKSLRNQGMILAPDGRKMSKSWGNVIAPDDVISQGYGADSVRIMELFIGPWDQAANWSVEGMGGCFRFLSRVWTLTHEYIGADNKQDQKDDVITRATHQLIAKVSKDLENMQFNTAISAMMEYINTLYKIKAEKGYVAGDSWKFGLSTLAQLLAPFAPHITEEIWQDLGNDGSVHQSGWPVHDEKYLVNDQLTIVVQVNGKLRATITVNADTDAETIKNLALSDTNIQKYLENKKPARVIYIPGRLVSIVI